MTHLKRVILVTGVVVLLAAGYTILEGEPVLLCCPTSGVGCYPVDLAQDCPVEGHFVSECTCPRTLPDGTTDCRC